MNRKPSQIGTLKVLIEAGFRDFHRDGCRGRLALCRWFSHGRFLSVKVLASATGQGDAQPQYEVAGNRLHKRSAEAGRNEFAAMPRRPCQAHTSLRRETVSSPSNL